MFVLKFNGFLYFFVQYKSECFGQAYIIPMLSNVVKIPIANENYIIPALKDRHFLFFVKYQYPWPKIKPLPINDIEKIYLSDLHN